MSGKVEGLDINLDLANANELDRFINNISNNPTSQLTLAGYAHYVQIYESSQRAYKTVWPNLQVSYDRIIPQYPAIFKDWDDSIIATFYINEGDSPENIIDFASIKPLKERPSTDSTEYTFVENG